MPPRVLSLLKPMPPGSYTMRLSSLLMRPRPLLVVPPRSNTSLWSLLWLLWTRLAVLTRRCGACKERRLLLLLQVLSVLSSSHVRVQSWVLLLILMLRFAALPRPLVSLRVLMWSVSSWSEGNSMCVKKGLLLLVMLLVVLACVAPLKVLLVPMPPGSYIFVIAAAVSIIVITMH